MLKRSKLEVSVLVLGGLVIASALFIKYFAALDPSSELVFTNVVFAVGFLIYILYSMLSSNNLNKEIRTLNERVESLNAKVAELEGKLDERNKKISSLEDEKSQLQQDKKELQEELSKVKEECDSLTKEITEIRGSQKEANP